jgi:SAM-dependent methyltransferase
LPDESADEIWLDTLWTFVSAHLPPAPARVIELGCGRRGGFVPFMAAAGYQPIGVDPEAPEGSHYRQAPFEDVDLGPDFDAVVASVSLHHVADLDEAIGKVASILRPGGRLIVIEWAWEHFDEATARWAFDRLRNEEGWLHGHRDQWRESGASWATCLHDWAAEEGLHRGTAVRQAIERRFRTDVLVHDAYLFPELDPPDVEVERAAIAAGEIHAVGIRCVATLA